jgi:hypothetical protein
MKKLLYSIVLLSVFFGAVFPAKAAPLLDPPLEDASWLCDFYLQELLAGDCPIPNDPVSPYTASNTVDLTENGHNAAPTISRAIIDCDPYPSCKTGMVVYFHVSVDYTWVSRAVYGDVNVQKRIIVYTSNFASGASSDWVDCGTGLSGSCHVELTGSLTQDSNAWSWDMQAELDNYQDHGTIFDVSDITYSVYFSLFPYGECEEYTVPFTQTFEIDPTIEFPVGPDGIPMDSQIYATVPGDTYQLSFDGGPWNDGTEDRGTETAISWDGETWTPFNELAFACYNEEGVFLVAESDTLHIRVDDVAGEFADNTNNPDPVLNAVLYTIGAAYTETPCEDQFSYDPEADLIASVVVDATDEDGELVSSTLAPEEWYAVTVTSGTWRDEGIDPDRTDMEFQETDEDFLSFDLANFQDLGSGTVGVWCQSTDETTWFMQASDVALHLRVNNNEITFWTANTGDLNVSVYHATFTRPRELCEFEFNFVGTPFKDEVAGSASAGKSFAYVPDGSNTTNTVMDTSSGTWSARPLQPGAWYILETVEGPWQEDVSQRAGRYDMSVSVGDNIWVPLEDWEIECNVALDALGHRRLYFQVPSGPLEWFLRVDDTTFNNNGGYMAWYLYRAKNIPGLDTGKDPWEGCIADTDSTMFDFSGSSELIPVNMDIGTYIRNPSTSTGSSATILSAGTTYIVGTAEGPWYDNIDDQLTDKYSAAVSSDNGVTWYTLGEDDVPGMECEQVDQQSRYRVIRFTVQDGEVWKIRVDDDAGDFGNNGGNLAYTIIALDPIGTNPGSTFGISPACDLPSLRPVLPTDMTELALWLQYVAQWIDYIGVAIRQFFIFCPKHIQTVISEVQSLRTREPFATLVDLNLLVGDVALDISSFAWEAEAGAAMSIFDAASAEQFDDIITDRIFPQERDARDPWDGGDILDIDQLQGGYTLPDSYNVCMSAFGGQLPYSVANGVCFVGVQFRETGASFWIQLVLDVACLFLGIRLTVHFITEAVYVLTGVRLTSSAGRETGLEKIAAYFERDERREVSRDAGVQELEKQFGGSFIRNRDGTYSRSS